MGIDIDAIVLTSKNMIDQRAQFNFNNRWFPNQVNGEFSQMNATSNINGVNSPLAFEPQQPMRPFADFGNSSPSRLLSDSHSNSTDTSYDPTPDGPEMENGNENCLSPASASVCSYAADCETDAYHKSIGTPNSFVGQMPGSPDMFSDYEHQRGRLLSTSSSIFTYSPYTPREEEPIPLAQSCNTPAFNRQTSLAIVEEVLGTTDELCAQPMDLFSDEDSVKPLDEDSCLPPYPSPSFTAHFNANNSNAEVITSSQGEEFFSLFCNELGQTVLLQCEGSPTTDSNNTNNNNCSNGDSQNTQSPVTQEVVTTCEGTMPQLAPPVCSISRQPSSFSDFITDSMPSNSLDASEMLQDCLNSLPKVPDNKSFPTVNIEILAVDVNDTNVDEQPGTSSMPCKTPFISTKENTEPSTSRKLGETESSAARRERNNEACRQSRKRRKSKKLEMEAEVVRYTEENAELQIKIEQLEVECKRMKQSILTVMTQNNSR